MSSLEGVKVGDELFVVEERRSHRLSEGGFETVVRIGREYVYTIKYARERRYRISNGVESSPGGYSGAQAYLDKAEHEAKVERGRLWGDINRSVRDCYQAPQWLTDDDLRKAHALLVKAVKP